MRFTQMLASAVALASSVSAGAVTTTVITTDYTTYCPSPTTFALKNITYTVTTPTTLTITNCPCTLTYSTPPPTTHTVVPPPPAPPVPVPGQTTAVPAPPVPVPGQTTAVPAPPGTTVITPPAETTLGGVVPIPGPGESTTRVPVAPTVAPTATGSPTLPTGAADKANAGFGAMILAGVVALVF